MASRAVIYVRISKDRAEQTSTDSQERECRALCERKGWEVLAVEVDKGRSAYKRNIKRPSLDRAMRMVETGAADVFVVWAIDRLGRSVVGLGELAKRIENAGADLAVVTQPIDTSDVMGRAMFGVISVFAELESAMKSERSKEWHESRRKSVLPPTGTVPYGFTRPSRGVLLVDADAAKRLTEAATRVAAGASLRSIVQDWNSKGVPSPSGCSWSTTGLRGLLVSPTTAGLREIDGVLLEGDWEPAVAVGVWTAARAVLLDPNRTNGGGSTAPRWMLTGVATCGRCRTGMHSTTHTNGHHRYHCPGCTLSITAEDLDELVSVSLLDLVDRDAWTSMRKRGTGPRVDVEALEAELVTLAEEYGAGEISRAEWKALRAKIVERTETAESLPMVLPDVDDLRPVWDRLQVPARQLVLAAFVESLVIAPAVRGRNRFDPDRVNIEWRV